MAACFPVPTSLLASLDKVAAFISCPEVASPRTPVLPAFSSPESEMSSVHPPRFENSSEWASSTKCRHPPGLAQRRGKLLLDEDLDTCCTERSSSTFVIDPGSASGQNPDCWSPQELVVMRLSLNDEWKPGGDDGRDGVTNSTPGTCEDQLLAGIFRAWDIAHRGSVGMGRVIDFPRHMSPEAEEHDLEELKNIFDPEERDSSVDLEAFRTIVKEWMARYRSTCCSSGGVTSRLSSIADDSVFELGDSISSGRAVSGTTDDMDVSSQGALEVSDLIDYVAHLHFNKQKLEEENPKFKLAIETLAEANGQLSEECAERRFQVKSAQQAIMRTNLLKEELEQLKISMNAAEEQKTMLEAQNKHLETENRALSRVCCPVLDQ